MTAVLPGPSVDERGRPVCELCRKPINPDARDVFCMVLGWVQNRSGGGAHAVSERRDIGRYRHAGCHKHGGEGLF